MTYNLTNENQYNQPIPSGFQWIPTSPAFFRLRGLSLPLIVHIATIYQDTKKVPSFDELLVSFKTTSRTLKANLLKLEIGGFIKITG